MKDLRPLIRLNQRSVDERRRALVQVQEALERLIAERDAFEVQVIQEQQLAATDILLMKSYPAFAKRVIERRDQFNYAIRMMHQDVAKAEEAVAEAFQELKKFEQVQEQRDQAAKQARRYRETQMFDEVASIRFSRQQGVAEEGGGEGG